MSGLQWFQQLWPGPPRASAVSANHDLVVEQVRQSGRDVFGWSIRPSGDPGRTLAEGEAATLEDGAQQVTRAARRLGLVGADLVEAPAFMTAEETAAYLADRPEVARRLGAPVASLPAPTAPDRSSVDASMIS